MLLMFKLNIVCLYTETSLGLLVIKLGLNLIRYYSYFKLVPEFVGVLATYVPVIVPLITGILGGGAKVVTVLLVLTLTLTSAKVEAEVVPVPTTGTPEVEDASEGVGLNGTTVPSFGIFIVLGGANVVGLVEFPFTVLFVEVVLVTFAADTIVNTPGGGDILLPPLLLLTFNEIFFNSYTFSPGPVL